MVRDDRVYFHLYPVLVHLARTVGLPIEIVKYIRDEVRASGIRARQALKGHILAGDILRWWLIEEVSYVGLAPVMTVPRLGTFERQRSMESATFELDASGESVLGTLRPIKALRWRLLWQRVLRCYECCMIVGCLPPPKVLRRKRAGDASLWDSAVPNRGAHSL